jgi:hypothetical protein
VTGRFVSADRKKDKINKNTYLITWDPENTAKKIYVPEDLILSEMTGIFESISVPVSEQALFKLIYCACEKIKGRWNQPLQNWALTIGQLALHFEGRLNLSLL